jgi:hypothetical protein
VYTVPKDLRFSLNNLKVEGRDLVRWREKFHAMEPNSSFSRYFLKKLFPFGTVYLYYNNIFLIEVVHLPAVDEDNFTV